MIKEFVNRFVENKSVLRDEFYKNEPNSYTDIVTTVINTITILDEIGYPDPNRIIKINDGDYQGTLVYVIGEYGYQPNDYWYVKIYYGSCGACDTLQGIKDAGEYDQDHPTEQQLDDYLTLALHIVQNIKKMD